MAPSTPHTEGTDVPLREYMDAQLQVVFERFRGMDKADLIQAQELARRLESLNHAADHAALLQATYIPRELYDKAHADLAHRVERLDGGQHLYLTRELFDNTIAEWRTWRTNVDMGLTRTAERKAVYAALVTSGIALLGIVATAIFILLGQHP